MVTPLPFAMQPDARYRGGIRRIGPWRVHLEYLHACSCNRSSIQGTTTWLYIYWWPACNRVMEAYVLRFRMLYLVLSGLVILLGFVVRHSPGRWFLGNP